MHSKYYFYYYRMRNKYIIINISVVEYSYLWKTQTIFFFYYIYIYAKQHFVCLFDSLKIKWAPKTKRRQIKLMKYYFRSITELVGANIVRFSFHFPLFLYIWPMIMLRGIALKSLASFKDIFLMIYESTFCNSISQ